MAIQKVGILKLSKRWGCNYGFLQGLGHDHESETKVRQRI